MPNRIEPTSDLTATDPPPSRRRRLPGPFGLFLLALGIVFVTYLVFVFPATDSFETLLWLFGFGSSSGGGLGKVINFAALLSLPVVLFLMWAGIYSAVMVVRRRAAAITVLGHVSAGVDMRVPLPRYLEAAAAGEKWLVRRRLLRVAGDVSAGGSLGESLTATLGELPQLTLDRIAAAERSLALGPALGRVVQHERERAAVGADRASGLRAYAFMLAMSIFTVTSMVLVFVIPKFAQIFADFKLPLPGVTLALINIMRLVFAVLSPSDLASALALILLGPGFVILIYQMLMRSTRGVFAWRPVRRAVRPVVDYVAWYTPFFGRATRDRNTAIACEALAEALVVGRPMPEAIASSAMPGLNGVLRRRMRAWQLKVAAGEPAAAAARASGLPRLWCDMLGGATADPATAVAFAAAAYRAAWHRRAVLSAAVAQVLVTLLMAAIVGFIALALMMPLVRLIDGMQVFPVRR